MNEKKAKYIVIPFLIVIFSFFLMNLVVPEETVSVSENRSLEEKPSMEDIKEGAYPSKFEDYYQDQFVFRKEMLRIQRMLEAILGKSVVGNYYLGRDNWILGMFPRVLTPGQLDKYAGSINELAQISHNLGEDVYFTLTPHKTNMLKHLYPEFVDNKENIDINKDAFKSRLNSNIITFIDLDEKMLNKFSDRQREKMYFKTDHHWNGTGAFEGFKLMVQEMNLGISPEVLKEHFSMYKTMEYDEKDFVGSYNSNLNMIVKEDEDPIYVYLENGNYEYFLNDGRKDIKLQAEDVIATLRDKDERDYGGAYIRGGVCNMLKIKNDNALTDKKILVFRDSYQAPTTLLFADLFSEVIFVDPRNITKIDMSYEEIINCADTDIVMFMYNSSGFDSMIIRMIDKGIK